MRKYTRPLILISAAVVFLSIGALEPLLHDHEADGASHDSCLACQWLSSPFIGSGITTLIVALCFITFSVATRTIQRRQTVFHVDAIRGPPRCVSL
jgi:hypothetical protein